MTKDEMVGWHHQFSGHELGQNPGDGEGKGSLAWCNPWGCEKPDMMSNRTDQLIVDSTVLDN